MKKNTINTYSNGVVCKFKNRRINILEDKTGGYNIQFVKLCETSEIANESHTHERVEKGRVKITSICLSEEAMEMMVESFILFRENKIKAINDILNSEVEKHKKNIDSLSNATE